MRRINDLNEVKKVLFELAYEEKEKYDKCQNSMLELMEIQNNLEKGKLTRYEEKYFYDFHRLDIDTRSIDEYLSIIHSDIFILNNKMDGVYKRKEKLFHAAKIIQAYQYIDNETTNLIKKELLDLCISNEDLIIIMEKIRIHNRNFNNRLKNYPESKNFHQLIDIFSFGYEYIPFDEYINSDKERLDREVDRIFTMLDSNSFDIAMDNLDLDEHYSAKEERYIYGKLLKIYQTTMMETVKLLKDERDFYFDKEILFEIKNDYYNAMRRYFFVRKLYDNVKDDKYEEELEDVVELDTTKENRLYYSSNSLEPDKCFFVRDLLGVREEALEDIQNLLLDFKNNNLRTGGLKKLHDTPEFELRDDQVRIILRKLDNYCYSVLGVFIKKSNRAYDVLDNIYKRPDAVINDKYSEEVENYYNNYIDENKRKGSR